MPHEIAPGVRSWASELDEATIEQAARTARLPILAGPIALMPDAHLGMGATIGSVDPHRDRGRSRRRWASTSAAAWLRAGSTAVGPSSPTRGSTDGSTRCAGRFPRDSVAGTARPRWRLLEVAQRSSAARRARSGASRLAARHAGLREPFRRARRGPGGLGLDPAALRVAGRREQARGPAHEGRTSLHAGLGTQLEDPELAWLQRGPPSSTPTSVTSVGPRPTRARTGVSCWWPATVSSSTSSAVRWRRPTR